MICNYELEITNYDFLQPQEGEEKAQRLEQK